jgi:phosphoribosylaminoimidazole carboxylase (NCAIR synthetase)
MQKEISDYKIGLLGGGQLGRMLLQSAMDLNLEVAIMDADPNAPCAHLVQHFTLGKLTDYDDVMHFGQDKDLITIEIESVRGYRHKGLSTTPYHSAHSRQTQAKEFLSIDWDTYRRFCFDRIQGGCIELFRNDTRRTQARNRRL